MWWILGIAYAQRAVRSAIEKSGKLLAKEKAKIIISILSCLLWFSNFTILMCLQIEFCKTTKIFLGSSKCDVYSGLAMLVCSHGIG